MGVPKLLATHRPAHPLFPPVPKPLSTSHYTTNKMAPHILDFKCVIITGGGGGLGFKMAEYFQNQKGKKVILVGRTESNLKEASEKLNGAPYYVLDTGKVEDIPAFKDKVIKEHPEVDALINNAGVQRPLEITELDLKKLDQELDIVSCARVGVHVCMSKRERH